MNEAPLFALGLALACLAGVRAYLTVFGAGVAALLGWLPLPDGLAVITSPWVLVTAGLLMLAEFAADKIPGVDSAWDLLHTALRVPVGAFLASAALAPAGDWSAPALLAGGTAALATHSLKSSARVVLNASPEPASNWLASITEDIAAITGLGLLLANPWWALAFLLSVLTAMAVTIYALWRGARAIGRRVLGTA